MRIIYLPLMEALKLQPTESTALVSIYSPGDKTGMPYDQWKYHCKVEVDDADPGRKGADKQKLFSEHEAKKLIRFVKTLPKKTDTIVVHCLAGIGRSAAVAKWLGDIYGEKVFPGECYNRHIYSTLDRVAKEQAFTIKQ